MHDGNGERIGPGRSSRREFLKAACAAGAAMAGAGGAAGAADGVAAAAAASGAPNVVIILTDDQGYGDLSCHGHPVLTTPNIDRLHDQGLRLADFHVAPVCTPTRSQLMTGLDCLHNRACCVPGGRNLLRRDVPTMPELFRAGGYRTGLFGKWHLGDCWPDRPIDRGFERAVWFRGWGLASDLEYDNDYNNVRYLDQTEVKRADRYCTDFWFDKAIEWMDGCRKEGRPFFCFVPTNAPHGPLWARPQDEEIYRRTLAEKAAREGQTAPSRPAGKGKKAGPAGAAGNAGLPAFLGMIGNIDDNVGKLERFLEQAHLRENTIVVFLNDNGATAGQRLYNAGLRGGKGMVYEGGHRAACFIRWPGGKGTGGGGQIKDPTHVQDLLPTLLDLCNLKAPEAAKFDGINLAERFLRNNERRDRGVDRMLVVQYGGRLNPVKHDACVIWGKWRLIKGKELYDIEEDRAQAHDVSARNAEVVRKMLDHYEAWWAGIEPTLGEYLPAFIGSRHENPVILTCNLWQGQDVDNNHRVAQGAGGPTGGPWNVQVDRAGTYEIELRRWPFHTGCSLRSAGPTQTVAGRPLAPGVSLAIAQGVLKAGGKELTASAKDGEAGVVFRLDLPAGRTQIQGWFRDASGKDLCGAFYAKFTRLP